MTTAHTNPVSPLDSLRKEAWDQAVYTYGTAYIFERRMKKFREKVRWVSYVAFGIPLIVGTIVLTFGVDENSLKWITWIAGGLAVIQVAISLWSIMAKWEDEMSHAVESYIQNTSLWERYARLAKNNLKPADFRTQLDLLAVENTSRKNQDGRMVVSDEEKRKGLRAGLWKFQRSCVTCKEIPQSLEPTDCGTCGNFKGENNQWIKMLRK